MSDDATLFDEKKDSGYMPDVPAVVPAMSLDSLYRVAVEKDFDADKMARVIEMVNTERARQSREAFELHFAAMQKELPVITKDRSAKDKNEKVTYRYATLENVLAKVTPILSAHGFSYAWRNETVADGATRVYCAISGYGHTRESYFDIPVLPASSWTNAIQQMGSSTSYGKRYSLCSALGIIIQDEDDDAQSFNLDEIMATAPAIAKIREAKTLEDLARVWKAVQEEYKSDDQLIDILIKAKDKRKAELAK